MPPQDEFVHCTVCQARTSKFVVIKEDLLCGGCLSTSTYHEGSTGTLKVEFIDQSLLESNSDNRVGFLPEGVVVKIENFIDGNEPTSMQYDRMVMIENDADDLQNMHHDRVTSRGAISTYRVGFLPEGVDVRIENDSVISKPVTLQHDRVQSRGVEDLNKSPVQVKFEYEEDMVVDSSAQPENQPVEHDVELKIEDELTIEETRLMDVPIIKPVDEKPIMGIAAPCTNNQEPIVEVKCSQCDKCFQQRKLLQQHVRRMHKFKLSSCDVCGLKLANKGRLIYHKRTAHESPKLQCPHCSKKFQMTNGLSRHILTHTMPKKDRRPVCETCGRKFKSLARLQKHMERKTVHLERSCPVCGIVIVGYERFEEHLALHPKPHRPPSPSKDLKVACRYCDHRTTCQSMLYKHYDECHKDDKLYRCRICFLFLKGKALFEQHIQEEHQGHQRQCDICLEGCDELAKLEVHKGTCLGRVLFKCTTCQESYVKKEALLKHLTKHDATEDHEILFSEVRSMQKIFCCALCDDDRGYEEEPYNTHVKGTHNGYHLLCPDCGAKFRQHKCFVNHRSGECRIGARAKEKVTSLYALVKSQCPHCPKYYKNRLSLSEHIRRIHKAKPAECDICGLKLASNDLVRSHKMSVHTEPKFECTHCQKKFSSKHNYQCHLISHQKEGSHLCEECGKKLKSKTNLEIHIKRTHNSGKTPSFKNKPSTSKEHKCKVCEKCFSAPVRLRLHMEIHDPNRKQYDCEMCDAKFFTKIGLKQHMANKDAHREVTCTVCGTFFKNRNRYDEHMLKHVKEAAQA